MGTPKDAKGDGAAATPTEDGGVGAEAAGGDEKPALYFRCRTQREKKWQERRQMRKAKKVGAKREMRKAKKLEEEDNGDAEDSDEDGDETAEDEQASVAPTKGTKRKLKAVEAAGAEPEVAAPEATVAAAEPEEATPKKTAKQRKNEKTRALKAEKAAMAAAKEKAVAEKAAAKKSAAEEKEASDAAAAKIRAEKTMRRKAEAAEEGAAAEAAAEAKEVAEREADWKGLKPSEVQEAIHPGGFFSGEKFEDLNVCDSIKRALAEQKFETLTEIQSKAIPHLLNGKDVLAAAKTGSGKTLAFLVPAIDLLYRVKFLPRNGVGALVISPTRELAMQIYDVLRNISKYLSQTFAIVVGGMNRRSEAEKLSKGVNTLVATPGRLLDHMQNTKGFVFHNLVNLIMDEGDRILEVGFEEEMNAIISMLPPKRQTALFSATQTRKVADLARLSMSKPVFVEVRTQDNVATVSGLTQGYVVCPAANRFMLLFTFLKKNIDKKVMVFFSACNAVKFHDELLNYIDIPVQSIHGQKKQGARSTTFYQFCAAEKGILLCTDVAARGLDIPRVDWIVQYDPPDECKEYIHRVGRTARGATGVGKALLFLMPEELGFLQYLRRAGVPVSEYSFPPNKLANIQQQLERVIEKNYHLHRSSRDAYRSYMHAYAAHSNKDCFDVHALDLQQLAKAFGFAHPPKVELHLKHAVRKKPGNLKGASKQLTGTSSGHSFSAENPYGKRAASDTRQFAR